MDPSWIPSVSGLLVPSSYWEQLRKARAEEERRLRGQFFSDYARPLFTGPQYGIHEKPLLTPSFQFLRAVARDSVIDRALIDARRTQIKRVAQPCWVPGKQIGFRVVHERYADPNFEATDDIRQRCREVMYRLQQVNREVHANLRDFFSIAVEEELVLDRKAMVVYRDRTGKPTRFHLLDGATIKPVLSVLLPYAERARLRDLREAAARYSEELTRQLGYPVDLTTARYVQVINGQVVAAWREGELDLDITNPTVQIDHVLYGRSVLEMSLRTTATFVSIWRYNDELFRTNIPEGVLLLYGDYNPQGLEAFKRQFLGEQSQGGNWRLPVIAAGPVSEGTKGEYLKVRDTPKDALFLELLQITAALKCAAYRAHPSLINFTLLGSSNSVVFNVNEEYAIALAQEEGFHGLLDSLAVWLTRALVKPCYDDLILIWEGLERQPDEKRIELRTKQLLYMTVNEVRAMEDLPPLPEGVPTSPGDMVLNPLYLQAMDKLGQLHAMAIDPFAEPEEQLAQLASEAADAKPNPVTDTTPDPGASAAAEANAPGQARPPTVQPPQ